jgi:hypothetical protein
MQFKLSFAPIAVLAIGATLVHAAPAGIDVSAGQSRYAGESTG